MSKTISAAVYMRDIVRGIGIVELAAEMSKRGALTAVLDGGGIFVNFTNQATLKGPNPENLVDLKRIEELTAYVHPFLLEHRPVTLGLPNNEFEVVAVLPAKEVKLDRSVSLVRRSGGCPWHTLRLRARGNKEFKQKDSDQLRDLLVCWRREWSSREGEHFTDPQLRLVLDGVGFRVSAADQMLTMPWVDLYLRIRSSKFVSIVEYIEFAN